MKRKGLGLKLGLVAALCSVPITGMAQQASPAATSAAVSSSSVPPPASTVTTTVGGTAGKFAMFTTGTNIENALISQSGSTVSLGGKLNLPATGTATSTGGKNSRPEAFVASVFNSGTSTAVPQTFQWQAEPVNNNTTTAAGTLNLLYASGTATPAETGLKIAKNGRMTFAAGQTFPGTAGLATANKFTANQSITGNLSVTGSVTGGAFSGNGSALTSVNAALLNGFGSGAFAFVGASNNFTASQSISGGLSVVGSGSPTIYGSTNAASGTVDGILGANLSGAVPALGAGVFGLTSVTGESTTGSTFPGQGGGVWGDGGSANYGVIGTADNGGAGGIFHNNGSGYYTLFAFNFATGGTGFPFAAYNGDGSGCNINTVGDLTCTGAKNAVVPIDSKKHWVALAAIESPKNWFEDFGSGELFGGVATVHLESKFTQTVNTAVEYHVFLTPNGDCRGLYVAQKTPTSFEVRELGGGNSNVKFDYRITALRKNYEKIRLADHTREFPLRPDGRVIAPKQ